MKTQSPQKNHLWCNTAKYLIYSMRYSSVFGWVGTFWLVLIILYSHHRNHTVCNASKMTPELNQHSKPSHFHNRRISWRANKKKKMGLLGRQWHFGATFEHFLGLFEIWSLENETCSRLYRVLLWAGFKMLKKINRSCCFLDKIANCCPFIHEKCKRLWSCSVQIIMTANHLWGSVRMISDPPQMAASAVCRCRQHIFIT